MPWTIPITLLMAVLVFPVGAEVYKWQDADGKTQYGDSPPAGIDATRMKTAPDPNVPPARGAEQEQESLQEQVKKADEAAANRKADQEAAAEKKRQEKLRKQACTIARNYSTKLRYGGHRLTQMEDGSYKRLTEEEKQQLIKENQDKIEKYCDKAASPQGAAERSP